MKVAIITRRIKNENRHQPAMNLDLQLRNQTSSTFKDPTTVQFGDVATLKYEDLDHTTGTITSVEGVLEMGRFTDLGNK